MGQQFLMSRDKLLAMAADPAFYDYCDEFQDLKEATLAAYARFAPTNTCCGGKINLMFPALDAIMARLHELQAGGNAVALVRVRSFLSIKQQRPFASVVIYYRKVATGFPDRILF